MSARLAFYLTPADERRKPGDGCGANAWYGATAGGTRLADPVARGLPDLRKTRVTWKLLAEADRKPKLSKAVQDYPKGARLTPPPGALILRLYYSFLDG